MGSCTSASRNASDQNVPSRMRSADTLPDNKMRETPVYTREQVAEAVQRNRAEAASRTVGRKIWLGVSGALITGASVGTVSYAGNAGYNGGGGGGADCGGGGGDGGGNC